MNKIYEITINGKIEIDENIDKDTEYSIALKRIQNDQGKVKKWTDKMDREVYTWTMVNLGEATLISGEKIIKGQPKKYKQSQALRFIIEAFYDEQLAGGDKFKDKESYYQYRMSQIIKEEEKKLL